MAGSSWLETAGRVVACDEHDDANHNGRVNNAFELLAQSGHCGPMMEHEGADIVS